MSRPTRKTVERIVEEEARQARVRFDDVLGARRAGGAAQARRNAIRRIMRETGCTAYGLAAVWGCNIDTIRRATGWHSRRAVEPRASYDADTIARLTARHGAVRTLDIINGRDEATNADLASWRRIWCGS